MSATAIIDIPKPTADGAQASSVARDELEALLVRAAQNPTVLTAAEAISELRARAKRLHLEMVGPTARLVNPPDEVKHQIRAQRRGGRRGERLSPRDPLQPPKPAKRVQAEGMKPCASDGEELATRRRALARIAHEMAHPCCTPTGIPRTLVDAKLDAIIAERDGIRDERDVDPAELAFVYDLPEHLVSLWLEDTPDPLAGLYDENDASQPAARRHTDSRDDGAAFTGNPYGAARAKFRSGLPPGRPKALRDCADVVAEMSGCTVEEARRLVNAGRVRPHEHARRDEMQRQDQLSYFLARIVKRGEATVAGLTETLRCSRSTLERRLEDGDWQPCPSVDEPTFVPRKGDPRGSSVFDDWGYGAEAGWL